jgi:phosphoadenosine phosphosulfate reductase
MSFMTTEDRPGIRLSSPFFNTRIEPEAPRKTEPEVRAAGADELAWIAEQSRRLEGRSPEEILEWAVERYFPRFTMATGLGPEGCVIISMLAKIEPRVYVFNLDTGYQFRETLELRDRMNEKYGMRIDLQRPELSVADYERQNGGPVYVNDSDRCCNDRKIAVLHRVAVNYDAWATGIRRDQSLTRTDTPIVKWDKKFGLVKISPLAGWTKKDVWTRILSEDVPYNPLHDQNYPSIGCQPCTRAVQPGEDERAGRWSGSAKTECGLHTAREP